MSDVTILPAPEIEPPATRENAWERERRAFFQLLTSLLKTNPGQYVAVHDGTVVAFGSDRINVALSAYERVGHVPLYVVFFGDAPRRRVRLLPPRVLRTSVGSVVQTHRSLRIREG